MNDHKKRVVNIHKIDDLARRARKGDLEAVSALKLELTTITIILAEQIAEREQIYKDKLISALDEAWFEKIYRKFKSCRVSLRDINEELEKIASQYHKDN